MSSDTMYGRAAVDGGIEDRDDVGMVERAGGTRFGDETT